ncbi:hypothetical protein NPIL_132191 [Nephila pilipes]|uniref:Uncharacterized protein n=1 Tax=Nephila pilipes TaxID=299642 RepID=A0A8X6PCR2_NEPPI|nr:hypothetical protein NPIL_132191 [Nephila pilipes]
MFNALAKLELKDIFGRRMLYTTFGGPDHDPCIHHPTTVLCDTQTAKVLKPETNAENSERKSCMPRERGDVKVMATLRTQRRQKFRHKTNRGVCYKMNAEKVKYLHYAKDAKNGKEFALRATRRTRKTCENER